MRVSNIFESVKFPLGSIAQTTGFTFGFEAEFLAKDSYLREIKEVVYLRDLVKYSPEYAFQKLFYIIEFDKDELIEQYKKEFGKKPILDVYDEMGADQFLYYFFTITNNTWKTSNNDTVFYENGVFTIETDLSYKGTYYKISEEISDMYGYSVKFLQDKDQKNFKTDYWYIEEDASVVDDENIAYSVEISTPIFKTIDDFNSALDDIFEYINNKEDLYTNSSCGFHINIGIPFKIDKLKFAIFAGEKYLKKIFPRFDSQADDELPGPNITKVLSNKIDFQNNFSHLVFLLNSKLEELENSFEDRFMINFKPYNNGLGYVEIRAPGGAKYEKRKEEIKQHTYRFVRLLHIASDPKAYKKEYIQKVYSLLSNHQDENKDSFVEKQFKKWINIETNHRFNEHPEVIKNLTKNPVQLFDFLANKDNISNFPPKSLLRLLMKEMNITTQDRFEYILKRPMGLYRSFGLTRTQDIEIINFVKYVADTMNFEFPKFILENMLSNDIK